MIFRRCFLPFQRCNFSTKLHVHKLVDTSQNLVRKNEYTVYLHGLLGNGKNLTTLARKFGGGALLLDLRGHGQSPGGTLPHTFEGCAKDVLETVRAEESVWKGMTSMVGHSLGGRIVLECAHQLWEESYSHRLTQQQDQRNNSTYYYYYHPSRQFWMLDTVPGEMNESVERVLIALHAIDLTNFTHRSQVSQSLQQDHHLDVSLAQWLASSIQQTSSNGLSWGFDLNVIDAFVPEFDSQDFWGKLEFLILSEQSDCVFHLVRGGKNPGWSRDIVSKLESLVEKSCGRFHMHVLPNAGHWVHVDDLPGLLRLWKQHQVP
jgi:pimeloyl-ACP methyl ester carboxylesterase